MASAYEPKPTKRVIPRLGGMNPYTGLPLDWLEKSSRIAERIYRTIPESALAVNRSITTGVAELISPTE